MPSGQLFKTAMPPVRKTFGTANLCRTSFLRDDETLPLVIEPNLSGVKLPAWIESNAEMVKNSLLIYGGILFRGFDLNTHTEFEAVARSLYSQLLHYAERTTPRANVSDWLYTSTEFPSDQAIALHNESSYAASWPTKLWFFCAKPAEEGGQTPLADVRKVYERLSPATRERFIEKGWMLVRNFNSGFGLDWQTSFGLSERSEVEAYCRRSLISFEWRGKNCLKTWQSRPAVIRHPETNELSWFNHVAFYHISSMPAALRQSLLSAFAEDELPFNTYYGDGSPIEPQVIFEIRDAYDKQTVQFSWQAGDALLLDNRLVAHGRKPFSGQRKILVAMAEPFHLNEIKG